MYKSINAIWQINRIKEINYMTISTDAGKTYDKIQHPLIINP
jgi:hypothetical protein